MLQREIAFDFPHPERFIILCTTKIEYAISIALRPATQIDLFQAEIELESSVANFKCIGGLPARLGSN